MYGTVGQLVTNICITILHDGDIIKTHFDVLWFIGRNLLVCIKTLQAYTYIRKTG